MSHGDPEPRGTSAFTRLARAVVRRPLVPIAIWLALLAATAPFLGHLGSVTTNSQDSLPSNAPSSVAQAELGRLFPNASGASSAVLLFTGADLTGRSGQSLIDNVTTAVQGDRALVDVASVSSVYTAYAAYLAGQTELAGGVVAAAQVGSPNLTATVSASADELWGPPARFLENWEPLVNASPSDPAASNAPAYNATAAELANSTAELSVLAAFYGGYDGAATGFNGTRGDCAADASSYADVVACADGSARSNVGPLLDHLAGANVSVGVTLLADLGIENASVSSAQRIAGAIVLAESSGLSAAWLARVWGSFGGADVSAAAAAQYADGLVNASTLADEPLPVPLGISDAYVSPLGTASLVNVAFSVSDDTTSASGVNLVDRDLGEISTVVGGVLLRSDPGGTVGFYETGSAPLDQLSSQAVNSSLALVLPLTVGLLLGIAMLYFRSPLAPVVAFGGLGLALILGLGGTVLVGTLVTHVDSSALVLEEVFVLGVGTDYSIFLLARYREELVRGRPSEEAIVTAVTWAGQSIATSGSTAIIVTGALAFSGVALLSQWGMVLSLAILVTMLVALTLLPALMRLLGPRLFWPMTGARFDRAAQASNARATEGRTYFYRAARAAERRPAVLVTAILLVSVPLVAVALQVPVSYDFYDQLPGGHSATEGLNELGATFGPGYAVPSFALVTFASPLVVANLSNATEFADVANLQGLAAESSGISSAHSPVGPTGANLSAWLALGSSPAPVREDLLATLAEYVGTDGRTVLFQLQTNATGLSYAAVTAVDHVESAFGAYAADHPEVTAIAYGGGAPTIDDLAEETTVATEVMLAAVTVGLVLVLLVVLRSWILALMAVGTIGLSISWAWALSDLLLQQLLGLPIFFYVRTILIMLVLGLGIDYNIFLLTRVREERLRGRRAEAAVVEAVGRTGGIITAAAVILASAFAALLVGEFTLIRAIGFAVAVAVVLDAMVVRTYLVPASLQLLGERVWPRGRIGGPVGAAPPAEGKS